MFNVTYRVHFFVVCTVKPIYDYAGPVKSLKRTTTFILWFNFLDLTLYIYRKVRIQFEICPERSHKYHRLNSEAEVNTGKDKVN